MSCLDKQHVSHKASMKHPFNLDSFMDETDREVMSLTDRAFKSLCIGDEAIYNDSEFIASPVNCHKPLACEEIPKKPALDVKKHGTHRPNGVYNAAYQMNKNPSKMSSLFAAFVAKKNMKMTNGDSWDKSALLSIQTELSEFSSDYEDHIYQVKSHRTPSEKGTGNKSTQDIQSSSGKSSKIHHGKSTKLRKLNSTNFFLHSEFSPFQSWRDLNRFGLENVDMFPCNSPAGLYDSPLHKELNNSNTLHVPEPNKRETSQSTSPLDRHKSKPNLSQCTAQTLKTGPPVSEKHSELILPKLPDIQIQPVQPQAQLTSSGSVQRCQSEGDLYAPWRKSRSRAKGVVQPLISSPAGERSNPGEQAAIQNKKEVRTVEEEATNSTPFSISQLLTPVIPSRQGTGTSEILQSVHSPTGLDIPAEIRPSPEIKREGYKAKASSLLFNLKDNRKRVKATYSPPKFKSLETADQNKLSPLIEKEVTQNVLESPEITDAETTLTVQKISMYPMSPESADIQNSQASGHINSMLPDDFLGLSLLQGSKSSKSKNNSLAKATYPSLHLYRKSSPVELNTRPVSLDVPGSHSTVNKSAEQKLIKEHLRTEKESRELRRKRNFTKPEIHNSSHEYTQLNQVETADKVLTSENTDTVALKEKYLPTVSKKHNTQQDASSRSGSRNQDTLSTKAEERPVKHNERQRKETKPKHLFSARQNNYIKNQRYAIVDNNEDVECECWEENVISAGKDEPRMKELNVDMQENIEDTCIKDGFTRNYYSEPLRNEQNTYAKPGVAKNASSMKGNTSAKIALFTLKEQPLNKDPGSRRKNIVKTKYELATVALEKMIAEREQRKKQSEQDLAMKRDRNQESTQVSGQKETSESVIPDRRGQKARSDFTPTSQNLVGISDIDTNHGECHVPEVKLAEPYKQEGTAKHSPSRLIYTDRSDRHSQQGDTSNITSMSKVTELKETANMSSIGHLGWESAAGQEYIENKLNRVGKDESSRERYKGSYKPGASPRRERANSWSEDRTMNERQRQEHVGSVEGSVKHEEWLSTEIKKSDIPKDEGPVKDNVSLLIENFNREQVVPSLNVEEYPSQGDGLVVYTGNEISKQKAVSPKDILGFSVGEEILTKHDNQTRESDSDKDIPGKDLILAMGGEETIGEELVTRNEEDVRRNEEDNQDVTENGTSNQTNSTYYEESFAKESLTEHYGKPDDESEKTLNFPNPDNRTTLYDILNQPVPSSSVDVKQLEQGGLLSTLSDAACVSYRTEESPSLNKGEERKFENLDPADSCSSSNPESKPQNSDIAVPPVKDVDKGGWVRCLIDSAHNLTPTCQSNASSPTLGKPALFKVKDNTFSASPVTKTVRPILHKTVAGVTQPWSPRESLSGSERGEEDPERFKDFVDLQSPAMPSTPVRITHPNQLSLPVVPPPSSQSTTDQDRTGLMDSSTVPEEEEWQLDMSSVPEAIEGCYMSAADTVGELAFNTIPTDSIEGSKAPSERSESVCSGVENQLQGRPPAVPPKTEKALRRAMKLTTKRIQRAEAKSKSDRGRSSEKGSFQKRERRHQSSDKVLSDRSYQREHSIDRGSSGQSTEENSSEMSLPRSYTSERNATQHNKPNSYRKEKDTGRKLQHGCHSNLINMDGDAKSSVADKQKDQFDTQDIDVDCERLGRTSEKYQPNKLYRRAHSLDRFSGSKYERRFLGSEDLVSKTDTETLHKHTTTPTAPLRQNSNEHTYGSPANPIVPQSFPMTQRKLLQDLDSGQYFVVDMPVQVKTKTFFDPETGRYVQLPVQSLEGSVPRAQSVEVVNAPPLMLYHGFVPVPVSSLP